MQEQVEMDLLSVYCQNVRGIRSKLDTVKVNSVILNFDIFFLTETFLNSSVLNGEIFESSLYSVFRRDRESTSSSKCDGGGVLIAVRKDIDAYQRIEWQSDAEDIWVTLRTSNTKNIHICCVYLPPADDTARACFVNKLQNLWQKLNDDIILMCGDFNMPEIEWVSNNNTKFILYPNNVNNKSSDLIDTFSFFELKQANSYLNLNNRILDLVLYKNVDLDNLLICDLPLVPVDDHHPPLEFTVNPCKIKTTKVKPSEVYNFRKGYYDQLNVFYKNLNWDNIFSSTLSVDKNLDHFYLTLREGIGRFVPKLRIKFHKFPSYFSAETIISIKEKNKIHKRWKLYRNTTDYNLFRGLRQHSKNLINQDYRKFVSSAEENISTNSKKFWKFISGSRRDGGLPGTMSYESRTASNPTDMCELFASYFKAVYEPQTQEYIKQEFVSNNLNNLNIHTLFVSETEVLKKLSTLDENKGAGSDGIPSYFFKKCAVGLFIPITKLFNQSLQSSTYPLLWKTAYLQPTFKNSGDRSSLVNYRGISKLCIISKVLESIIFDQLFATLKRIIIKEQHGFFSGRSIDTNLFLYFQFLSEAVDSRVQVDSVYTDFSKAFDKVNHNILIDKLAGVGVQGSLLCWFASYLHGRMQKITISNCLSRPILVTSGVPQGSHLGPLLFLIYINDICECFLYSKFLLYADDLKIFHRIESLEDCEKLQQDLNRVVLFCTENKLNLNLNKCFCISFTKNKSALNYNYLINDNQLERVLQIKDLGVIFDCKLAFNLHIDYVVSKCSRLLGFVGRTCKHFSSERAIKTIYYAFIYSRLNFACIIWNPFYEVYKLRLERLQNRFVRFLNWRVRGVYGVASVSAAREFFNLSTLESRRIKSGLIFIYKVFNNTYDSPDLLSLFHLHVPARNTRQLIYLAPSFSRTNLGMNSPVYRISSHVNIYCQDLDLFNISLGMFKGTLDRSLPL